MANALDYVPQAEGVELNYLEAIFARLDDAQARRFATAYATRRRDTTTMIVLAALGFFGAAGIHRFLVGNVGMGVLYLLTGGLCMIGTIIDLINIRQMTADYNMTIAQELAGSV